MRRTLFGAGHDSMLGRRLSQTLVFVIQLPVGGPGFLGQVGASGNDRINMARPVFASSDTGYFLFVAGVTVLCTSFWSKRIAAAKPGRSWGVDPQERTHGGRRRRADRFL